MGKTKTLAQHIAELEDPAPRDFDPEGNGTPRTRDDWSDSQDSDDGLIGTEHYVEVGKSRIQKREEVPLGPQYAGARISRKNLEDSSDSRKDPCSKYGGATEIQEPEVFADLDGVEMEVDEDEVEIDSYEAFGESDSEKFKGFTFRGSATSRKANEERRKRKTAADFMADSEVESKPESASDDEALEATVNESNGEKDMDDKSSKNGVVGGEDESEGLEEFDSDSGTEDETEESDSGSDSADDDEQARRAELRKIMAEEQKTIVATISQAAKTDVEKGRAVKQQRKVFDSLLNVRIQLQKGLVAINSMGISNEKDVNTTQPYQAAEEAAIKLLNTLDAMRQELERSSSFVKAGTKRKRLFELDTPRSVIWQRLQDSESLAIGNRQVTIEKWSTKVRGTIALPVVRNKLNATPSQTITSILQDQLSTPERLIKRTKTPRSCAPLQAKLKIAEDPTIYDDADFYQLLLKELIDQRMADSSSLPSGTGILAPVGIDERPVAQWTAVKEVKTKKNVDTRASKGRKLRYTVHEKLQNFMAPEDRGSWEQETVDRFFGSLLGQRLDLGEEIDGTGDNGSVEEDDTQLAEEALMLFRS